jgi:hypothetical protein
MDVQMAPAGFRPVQVRLVFKFNRDSNKTSVADPALGNDVGGEAVDIAHLPSEDCNLHATDVVEVHMHRCDRQIVVIVKRPDEALRHSPLQMVIYVDEGRHPRSGIVLAVLLPLGNSRSSEIADRLRPILVPICRDDSIERGYEFVVESNRNALHF